MWKEFKEFAVKGNVIDMAVGIIIGAAFSTIVTSFVNDVIMPPIGLLLGGVDFSNFFVVLKEGSVPPPYETIAAANEAGAVILSYGAFINTIISFLIVAFAIFIVIRYINSLKRSPEEVTEKAPTTKNCTFCISEIPVKATRCPNCTSELAG
ncbi:MAG TPA: large conductance mechanosensitive channel protein MscL [Fodinibius sp.]|nr:large conductance mechanosensitive channel protein MscL [Fodinibius sp.]